MVVPPGGKYWNTLTTAHLAYAAVRCGRLGIPCYDEGDYIKLNCMYVCFRVKLNCMYVFM